MAEVNIKRVKSSEIEFKDRLVAINRVTKVTKGGRTFTFAAIVVIGNENGVVGYGLGKAKEVQAAIQKGVDDAKKNLIKVPVLKGTIPHEQCGKYSGARYRCYCRWRYACRSRERRSEGRVGKVQGFVQSSQRCEGYYQCPPSDEGSLHGCRTPWHHP